MATLLEKPMEKFQTVLDLLLKHRNALGYGLVSLLTAGGERIFSAVVFQCPCSASWNLPYGLVFLFVPALLLFILAFVLRTHTWLWLTGCCMPDATTCAETDATTSAETDAKTSAETDAKTSAEMGKTGKQSCKVCLEITATALVAPLTWVAVALLGGTFYQCGASGTAPIVQYLCSGRQDDCMTLLPKMPCLQDKEPGLLDLLQELRAHSQVGGWMLIAVIVLCLLAGTCYSRCRSPVSFMQLTFQETYLEEEQKMLAKETTEHANKLAKENVNRFFGGSRSEHVQIPSPEAWKQISSLYTFNKDGQYYSLLHKYISERDGNYDPRPERADEAEDTV